MINHALVSILGKKRNASAPGYEGTLTTGLLHEYHQADGTDGVGSTNLSPVSSPGVGVGKVNAACISLNGGNYLNLADGLAADFEPNLEMTISFWIKPAVLSNYNGIYSKTSAIQMRSYLGVDGSFITNHQGGTRGGSGGQIVAGNWYHVIIYHNPGATLARWVNNVADGSSAPGVGGGTVNSFCLGSLDGVNRYNGLIDQFCLWHRALTTDEKTELYNGGTGIDILA